MSIGVRLRQETYLNKKVLIKDVTCYYPYILRHKDVKKQLPEHITPKRLLDYFPHDKKTKLVEGEEATVEALVDVPGVTNQVLVVSIIRKRKRKYIAISEEGVELVNKIDESVDNEKNFEERPNINLR